MKILHPLVVMKKGGLEAFPGFWRDSASRSACLRQGCLEDKALCLFFALQSLRRSPSLWVKGSAACGGWG